MFLLALFFGCTLPLLLGNPPFYIPSICYITCVFCFCRRSGDSTAQGSSSGGYQPNYDPDVGLSNSDSFEDSTASSDEVVPALFLHLYPFLPSHFLFFSPPGLQVILGILQICNHLTFLVHAQLKVYILNMLINGILKDLSITT